ncbi:MAG: porin [Deltaproteobacteria bacterium]|nr:porin [Deltaproteobacteria bacterium]
MKRGVMKVVFVAVLFLILKPLYAQEAKGLGPGWLSLDSSVGLIDKRVDDTKSALEKALRISISGFLDTSYTWSSNRPGFGSSDDISLRVFDQDHNEVVFNHFNLTLEKPEKDWGMGLKLVADFGRTAELLREATLWGSKLQVPGVNGGEPSAELREAFITFTLPIGKGLQVKGGKFVTLMGTEVIPAPGSPNPNISRSYLFGFAIPFTHTGVLFSYPVMDMLTLMAGPVTGWDNPHDNNRQPSFHGGFTFTPAELFSLTTSVMDGPEQKHHSGRNRFTFSNVATIKPMSALTLFLEYTYGHEDKVTASLRDGTWQGLAAIASYDWTERFNTAVRGEFFRDSDGVRTGGDLLGTHEDVRLGELTLTAAYKFTAKLLGRVEVRQDSANRRVFQEGNTGSDRHQTTFALQAIYTF